MADNTTRVSHNKRSTGNVTLNFPEPIKTPAFPIFLFSIALFKDLFDIFDITIIFIFFTTFFSFFIWFWTFLWLWGKGGFIRKLLFKKVWAKLIILFLADFIPFIKIFSGASVLIFMVSGYEKELAGESQAESSAIIRKAHSSINRDVE